MTVLAFIIIRPFVTAILASIIIAYIAYPLYRLINKKLKRRNLSSVIVTIIIIIIIVGPIFFALQIITKETYTIYLLSKQKIISGEILNVECLGDNFVCKTSNSIKEFISDPKVSFQLQELVQKSTSFIMGYVSDFVLSVPSIVINFFITVFIVFFLLRDGEDIAEKVKRLLPLKKHYQKRVFEKSKEVTFAVVYGHLSVALIQGALGGIGFLIFGVSSPLLWGLVMAFAALIPFVGTPIVWLPVSLLRMFNGFSTGDNAVIMSGILLFLYGGLIVSTIDNFLKPKIIGDKAKVHPILVLLGVLGGLKVFGFIGIVIGPVILAIFKIAVRIYEEERGLVKSEA